MSKTITLENPDGSIFGVRKDKNGNIYFIFVPSDNQYKAIVYKDDIDKLINFIKNA